MNIGSFFDIILVKPGDIFLCRSKFDDKIDGSYVYFKYIGKERGLPPSKVMFELIYMSDGGNCLTNRKEGFEKVKIGGIIAYNLVEYRYIDHFIYLGNDVTKLPKTPYKEVIKEVIKEVPKYKNRVLHRHTFTEKYNSTLIDKIYIWYCTKIMKRDFEESYTEEQIIPNEEK